MATASPLIEDLTTADLAAVQAILEPSQLHVDLVAELERDFALRWVARDEPSAPALAFLLAWNVVDELQLLELATHPEQRRRGLARALLERLIDFAKKRHKRLLLLEVRRSNLAAIGLYESAGFVTTGVRRGYYSDTGEDALEMRITFDPTSGQIVPSDL